MSVEAPQAGIAPFPLNPALLDERVGVGRRLLLSIQRHRLDLGIVLLLLVVTLLFHGIGMSNNPERGDDEGTYVAQAWAVQQGELAHYTYWYDHPPMGWIQLAAFDSVTGAFDDADTTVGAGRHAMLVAKGVSVVAMYALMRRLRFSAVAGALAVLLFGLSPLGLEFQRAVWLDNLAIMWLLIAFALAADPAARMRSSVVAALSFAMAVLTKETTLLVAPFLGWLLWRARPATTRTMNVVMASTLAGTVIVGYPLLALLRGELFPGDGHVSLLWAAHWQVFARDGSGSIFADGTDANNVVSGWIDADPFLLLLGAVVAIPALWSPRLRPLAAALVFHLAMPFRGGYLPVPYVIILIPLIAMVVAGVFDEALGRATNGRWGSTTAAHRAPVNLDASQMRIDELARRAPVARSGLVWWAGIASVVGVAVGLRLVWPLLDAPGAYGTVVRGLVLVAAVAVCLLVGAALSGQALAPWFRFALVERPSTLTAGAAPAPAAGRASRLAGGAVLAGVIATLAFALAPAWASTHAGGELTTPTADAGVSGAQDWVLANVPTDATLIVEDSMWLDLVLAGYERDNVVWFFKVDLDPGVQIDPVQVDYVVLHDYVADGARPVLASTLQLAEPVASFGEGVGRMTVWEVNGS